VVPRTGSSPESAARERVGLAYGITAYTLWGIFPLYFRAVAHVSPVVVLCHRILWSALFMGAVISLRREWPEIFVAVRNRRSLWLLTAGALLIAVNWLIFIYAVGSRQVLQASLGYFINPLLSVALGMVFLKERLRGWQWVAVGVAAVAVVNLTVRGSGFPWIAVSLATSFGFYGLVRKKVDINSLHGLLIESFILFPAALVALFFLPGTRLSAGTWGILSLSGVITAVPLLFFGEALRRLKLMTVGFLQYIGPTLQFLVAVLLLNERLDHLRLVSFGICWAAIAIYVADSVWSHLPQGVADEPE
jgi:chloramphenicol-sensitive protein RarD